MHSWTRILLSLFMAAALAGCGGGNGGLETARSAAAGDALGPHVESITPAAHSLNVPRNSALVVRFAQPIIASSVGRQSLRLLGPHGPVAGSFGFSTCGTLGPCEFPSGVTQEVVFRPDAPLQPSTQYHVEVVNVRAVGGATVVRYRAAFMTEIIHGAESRLATGGGNSCAVLADGRTKCWGHNSAGQLGINSSDPHGNGTPTGGMGDDLPAVLLGEGRTAVQVAVGDGHSCALLDDASVKCWGSNQQGQLGQGSSTNLGTQYNHMNLVQPVALALPAGDKVASIAAAGFRTCALSQQGVLKCWGQNKSVLPGDTSAGYLGLGDSEHHGDDALEMGANLPAVNVGTGRRVAQVAMGAWHTCALLDDASLKCWGRNNAGQLGLGHASHLGSSPLHMGDALAAVDLGDRRALRVTAGELHTCALLDDRSVKCWGSNVGGRLGLGNGNPVNHGDEAAEMGDNLPAIRLGDLPPVAITAGKDHTCVRLGNGAVKCWGLNYAGQLGLGSNTVQGDVSTEMGNNLLALDLAGTVVAVSGGGSFSCARMQSGAVKCWGDNDGGQLGIGHTSDWGDAPLEMGDHLPELSL